MTACYGLEEANWCLVSCKNVVFVKMKLKNKVGIRKKVSLGSKVAQKNCSTFTAILTGGGPWKLVEYNRKRREKGGESQ